ncbi:MAG: LysM peptidoglycan-binding domain-containing protein [Chitinophagales bacterium]
MGQMDFFKKGNERSFGSKTNKEVIPVIRVPETRREYIIGPGDTLSGIAKKFYGKEDWKKIYEANKNKINTPDLINPGIKIIIP